MKTTDLVVNYLKRKLRAGCVQAGQATIALEPGGENRHDWVVIGMGGPPVAGHSHCSRFWVLFLPCLPSGPYVLRRLLANSCGQPEEIVWHPREEIIWHPREDGVCAKMRELGRFIRELIRQGFTPLESISSAIAEKAVGESVRCRKGIDHPMDTDN
jgi:hypothetical protein